MEAKKYTCIPEGAKSLPQGVGLAVVMKLLMSRNPKTPGYQRLQGMAVLVSCRAEELIFLPFCYWLLADRGQGAEWAHGLPQFGCSESAVHYKGKYKTGGWG